ncbi:MAG TPA: M48 family metallopeptidase [Candidatus Binatia bacterium]|jgi:predicted Zn-dependent protease|nr:M48 family metallopeptidase [Candidatus Binatia bacterium]
MGPRVRWALAALAVVAACAKVPYTGRSQLILVSSQQEAQMGAQAFQQVVTESRVVTSPNVVAPVDDVGRRLAAVANRPDFQWQFVVIDDSAQVNAFCLPGGKVAVYTGILPVAQDTNGLAVVMGHEIAHALARHGAERMSQAAVAEAGGAVLGAATQSQAVMAAYGLGAQYGVLLPYGRSQESEADRIGLLLMAQAGYDPRAAIGFWERMGKTGGGGAPEFLSTHPSHGTRTQQLQEWMPEALALYEKSSKVTNAPLAVVAR